MTGPGRTGCELVRAFVHWRMDHRMSRLPIGRAVITVTLVALIAAPAALRAQADSAMTPGVVSADADSALPDEMPKPFSELSRSALALGDSIVRLARQQLGKRYVRGGESPRRGFDCSGLVQYIADALHLSVPRTARLQARAGDPVPADTALLLPGDILTFGHGRRTSHVGIYVGDGRFIHASTKAGRVIETTLLRPPARGIKPWIGARRLVLGDSASTND